MRSCDGNWSCEEQAYMLVSQEKVADTYKSNLEKFMESRIKIYIFVQWLKPMQVWSSLEFK